MTRETTYPESLRRLRLPVLRPYLETRGWERAPDYKGALAVFRKRSNSTYQLLVPIHPEFDDFDEQMRTLVSRIAEAEGRSERAVLEDIYAEEARMMIEPMPRPNWQPVPRPGTVGVTGRVMLKRAGLALANLRFSLNATIDEHSAPFEIDVICIAGEGFVSVGSESSPFRAGERVVWPAGVNHRLWTEGTEMETLMIERNGV